MNMTAQKRVFDKRVFDKGVFDKKIYDMRVYDMTGREWRTYNRVLRQQREARRKVILCFMTAILILICVISYHSISSSASTGSEQINFKYYTATSLEYGETLWQIADQYIDYTQYRDKETYLREVRSINHIEDDAAIQAGQTLIMPYFSTEFVQ